MSWGIPIFIYELAIVEIYKKNRAFYLKGRVFSCILFRGYARNIAQHAAKWEVRSAPKRVVSGCTFMILCRVQSLLDYHAHWLT